ncbi:MAG: DtxR family transcriptional regulator, Mn-dependent transcriptional regulator [Chloroflexi bacterium]|jgi:DtxR family Mn-dependent transcriptional regulator|nr:MAG: DtxR family transcriptional regulator, Mn-dependent transcriptional regulator [Chloroflexota bacterium]
MLIAFVTEAGMVASAQGQATEREQPEELHSPAVENYLLALYDLQEERGYPTLSELASHLRHFPPSEALGTTLPSVSGMLRRLQREELVEIGKDKRARLTDRGTQAGKDVARRHHLAECLLVDLLGVDLPDADEEAHRLEHFISPEVLESIFQRLGQPSTCPYGRPIPDSGYIKPESPHVPLNRTISGETYCIAMLPEDDKLLVAFLAENHIVPGQVVLVKELATYRDAVVLGINGSEISIGSRVAESIKVLPSN